MKNIFLFIVGSLFPILLLAQEPQEAQYTFVEDRQFIKESDVFGYTFIPSQGKMGTAHYPDPVKAGLVSFTISSADVIVHEQAKFTPGGISGVDAEAKPYSLRIARIEKTTYGYELQLVDIRNRELQGHLKIYIDAISQVDMLKYRPSKADHEHIYMVKRTPKGQGLLDGKYFTHQLDFDARTLDEFWGKTLYPFMSLEQESDINNRKISRIQSEDDMTVKFTEKLVLKGKKEKLQQYIHFTTKNGVKLEYLLKKAKEVQHQNRDGNRKVLELLVRDEFKQEDHYILMHRGVKSMLKAIEVQDGKTRQSILYYEMRKGKRII